MQSSESSGTAGQGWDAFGPAIVTRSVSEGERFVILQFQNHLERSPSLTLRVRLAGKPSHGRDVTRAWMIDQLAAVQLAVHRCGSPRGGSVEAGEIEFHVGHEHSRTMTWQVADD